MEVQHAVDDLIRVVTAYALDPRVGRVSEEELLRLRRHYNHFMFQVLFLSVHYSGVCWGVCVAMDVRLKIHNTTQRNHTLQQALLHCAKNSMDALKKRIAPRSLLRPSASTAAAAGGCVHNSQFS